MTEPIWTKQLDDESTLYEYPKEKNALTCTIVIRGIDEEEEPFSINFGFGSWGMDRDEIKPEDVADCCQCLLDQNANVSVTSFKANLEWARTHWSNDDE